MVRFNTDIPKEGVKLAILFEPVCTGVSPLPLWQACKPACLYVSYVGSFRYLWFS